MGTIKPWLAAALLGTAVAFGPAAALAAKDTFSIGAVLEPPHLDPTAGAAAAIDEVVHINVFEGLVRLDEQGQILPLLAESWTVSDDGLTYTFKLHDGVTFHDGTTFDSADVKYSFSRAVAPNSVNAQKGLFAPIKSIETPDPLTVVLTLEKPAGQLLFNLTWGDAVIVAPESAGESEKTKPIGTGPFTFKEWVKGDRVELVRNDAYWGEKPALTSATFKFIADPAAALQAILAGDLDAFSNFPAPENLPQLEADPRFKVAIGTTEGETILAMNNGAKPFNDIRVRRAVAHAIDRQAVIDGQFGYGTPIGSHFAPHAPGYLDLTDRYPYDPDAAKALLTEAGYPDGFKTVLMLPPPPYARRGGEIIAAMLADVGIKAEIVPLEWAQWLDQVFKNKAYGMTIVSHTEPMDISIYARDNYYFNYDNADFKALMAKIDATTDQAERTALYGDAQRMIAEDSVNAFLFQLPQYGVWNVKVEGLWTDRPFQVNDLTKVHWTE
ncbi:ABC transporter substrate-binding protein [Tistrella bauzanensis]|uniref:ABC transporter substrate-binding protein n=1 Tax=Tistrella bauzanensis TaxID=657419 RepID=A0ABQ1J3G7_9PROT|nr:ABC transporter substrate-binding protein [Tistrella bauzanensis]GGB56503.1 ABC transporter substrate-binding protein [Tistrella bauzanensis]